MALDDDHLSWITTHWTLLLRAHGADADARKAAQAELLSRYFRAIYRYVRSLVPDEAAVEELCQRFGVRFLEGAFRNASPDVGRFRDYVKRAVIHLVRDWERDRRARTRPLDSAVLASLASPADTEKQFEEEWRGELIEKVWERLAAYQAQRKGRCVYTVFRYGAEHPDRTAAQVAEELSRRLNRPLTEQGVWKTLERGRKKFAEFLLDEVALSLGNPTADELRGEVSELGLLRYCEEALATRGR
jgi:RNA polymerase sigma factor (sigma-70 family)